MENDKTPIPLWFKLMVIVLTLPAAGFPILVSAADTVQSASSVFPAIGEENPVRLLAWLYPAYMAASAICSWMCWRQRREMSWILLALMLLSTASVYYLTLA